MSNSIKYSTNPETLALKSGNFWIGTGDVSKGPTSTTGYWNGITPPSNGYTIYLNKTTGGPSIYIANNDSELITLTNQIANTSFTTVQQCFTYYSTQNDKMVFNQDYPPIVTDGLVLNLDAGFRPSYPTSGTTWFDLSGNNNNATLVNGPTFDSGNNGIIQFDGVDDSGQLQFQFSNTYTINIIIKFTGLVTGNRAIIDLGNIVPSVRLYLQNSKIKIQHESAFAITGLLTTQNVSTNVWKNYTITGNGSFCQIFEDGVLNNSGNVTRSPEIGLRQMGIADKPTGSSSAISPLNCDISLLQIYNRVLTPSEILQNYNATKGRFGL